MYYQLRFLIVLLFVFAMGGYEADAQNIGRDGRINYFEDNKPGFWHFELEEDYFIEIPRELAPPNPAAVVCEESIEVNWRSRNIASLFLQRPRSFSEAALASFDTLAQYCDGLQQVRIRAVDKKLLNWPSDMEEYYLTVLVKRDRSVTLIDDGYLRLAQEEKCSDAGGSNNETCKNLRAYFCSIGDQLCDELGRRFQMHAEELERKRRERVAAMGVALAGAVVTTAVVSDEIGTARLRRRFFLI